MQYLRNWFNRHFSDPQVVILMLVLLSVLGIVLLIGNQLAPVIAALVVAYLLQGVVARVERLRVPRMISILIVFAAFMAGMFALVFILIPLLTRQITQLFQQIPFMLSEAQRLLMQLPVEYPDLVTEGQIEEFIGTLSTELLNYRQPILSFSVSSLFGVFTVVVYLIVVPFMVFFMMRDRDRIIGWLTGFLPEERPLTDQVWAVVDAQIGNYVRGKVWEIFIVGSVTYAVFAILGLQYAVLLAVLTGFSVLIPYIGATVIAVPVMIIAYFQFGGSAEFWYVAGAYGLIQAIDGNVLVPLIFSEVVDLHPLAIIVAVLFFGSLWGFWGLFFAIPLATVIQAVLVAWPRPATAPDVPEARSVTGARIGPDPAAKTAGTTGSEAIGRRTAT